MALYDAAIRGTLGLGKAVLGGTAAFARGFPSGFMMAGGAAIGAASAAYQGDNYSSTDLMRNIIGGAAAGGLAGLSARALFSHTAARGAGRFLGISQARRASSGMKLAAWKGSPVGKLLGTGRTSAAGAVGGSAKLLGFAGRHPGLVIGGGIMTAGALSIAGNLTTEEDTNERLNPMNRDLDADEQSNQSFTSSAFANSASGLSFALHNRRHR